MSAAEKLLLLVEDTPADIALAQAALAHVRQAHTCLPFNDGETALTYLKTRPDALPDLILLDLNLPGMHGREVLAEIKSSIMLRHIPVVILTTSSAQCDSQDAYARHANSFVTKPANLDDYSRTMCEIVHYWFETVTLPNAPSRTEF